MTDGLVVDLPRAWCARSVSSFCVALFCKTSGSTRTVQSRKKKTVARLSESLRFTREMAESTECSTCGRQGGRRGTARCAAAFRRRRGRAARRLAGGGRLDDSAANRRARSHCLHASHWIVIFVESRTTTATTTTVHFVCNGARESEMRVSLARARENKSLVR